MEGFTEPITFTNATTNTIICSLYFFNIGFAVTWCKEEKTTHSYVVYRVVYLFGIGSSTLFNLALPVKVNLIILCAMFLIFSPLHLLVTCCSDPLPHVFNEAPIYYIDE